MAGGIFLAPFINRKEPKKQHLLVYGLLGAVVVVVVGASAVIVQVPTCGTHNHLVVEMPNSSITAPIFSGLILIFSIRGA